MNRDLPERFPMSDSDIPLAIMRQRSKTKRELLKEAHSAWAATGQPKPRGWTLPPFREVRAMLEQSIPAFHDLYKQVAGGKVMGEQAIAGRIREIEQIGRFEVRTIERVCAAESASLATVFEIA